MSCEHEAGLKSPDAATTWTLCVDEVMLTSKCAGEGELLDFLLEIVW